VLDWLAVLRQMDQRPAVIVWGAALSEAEALRMLQAGAAGVVRKTSKLDSVMACVRAVAAGGSWMEDSMMWEQGRPYRAARSPLTGRELEVMELVERGLKNKDIASALGIRIGTVKIHLKHIFEKTGIRGRYGLALSGLKEKGLLMSPPWKPRHSYLRETAWRGISEERWHPELLPCFWKLIFRDCGSKPEGTN
jgi:DNA-binding NarL/FixJ family response regulator